MEFWNNPESDIIKYHIKLTQMLDPEWIVWDIDTIAESLYKEYNIIINKYDRNKINALKTTFNNLNVWNDFLTFEKVGLAFNNYIPNFDRIEKLRTEEILVFLKKLKQVERHPFGDEIISYCASSLYEDGYLYAIEDLYFCQETLNKLNYLEEETVKKYIRAINTNNLKNLSEEEIKIIKTQQEKIIYLKKYVKMVMDNG